MGGAVLDGRAARSVALEQAVDQAGREAVAAADAVEDLESGRCVASTKPSSRDQAIAPQSLTVALWTARSVVAITLKFG